MKLDILAFGAHPDDVELSCSGTLLAAKAQGKRIGIVDMTIGEMGTRGTVEDRQEELEAASKILGLDVREQLSLRDGFLVNDEASRLKVISVIRKYQPALVLCNALRDRHRDHGIAGDLVSDAVFLSGLRKIETEWEGEKQEAFRPARIYRYIQDRWINPSLVVDISPYFEKKMESILAYKSQFVNSESKEPKTYISDPNFLETIRARAIEMGKMIYCQYGEGFTADRVPGTDEITKLI